MRPMLFGGAGRNDDGVVRLQECFDFGVGHLAKKNSGRLHSGRRDSILTRNISPGFKKLREPAMPAYEIHYIPLTCLRSCKSLGCVQRSQRILGRCERLCRTEEEIREPKPFDRRDRMSGQW